HEEHPEDEPGWHVLLYRRRAPGAADRFDVQGRCVFQIEGVRAGGDSGPAHQRRYAQRESHAENALPEGEELRRRQGGIGEERELGRRTFPVERRVQRALEIERHDEDKRRRSTAHAVARSGFVRRRRCGVKTVPRQLTRKAVGELWI